jgi:pilus assembly protein Flp/PilA
MNFKTASGLLHDESGATAIEYGLIVALLALASLVALTAMGDALIAVLTRAQTALMDSIN